MSEILKRPIISEKSAVKLSVRSLGSSSSSRSRSIKSLDPNELKEELKFLDFDEKTFIGVDQMM